MAVGGGGVAIGINSGLGAADHAAFHRGVRTRLQGYALATVDLGVGPGQTKGHSL